MQWFRRFVPHLATHISQMTNITSKKKEFYWDTQLQHQLNICLDYFAKKTLLYYLKFNKPFHISTDASDVGIGAIVYQIDQQDQIHPIYFYSKKLTNTKIKIMSIVEKEAFAIVCILEHLRSMLLGQQIKIYCDNRNVMYMENCKGLHKLQNISQKVSKIEGKDNSVADLLSRIYDNDSEQHNTIPLEVFAIDDFPLSYNYISI